jgi:hypothetical protein
MFRPWVQLDILIDVQDAFFFFLRGTKTPHIVTHMVCYDGSEHELSGKVKSLKRARLTCQEKTPSLTSESSLALKQL